MFKCSNPKVLEANGKIRNLNKRNMKNTLDTIIECKKCYECKKQKAREWTLKMEYEAKEWKYTYFITLTYKKHPGQLIKSDLQKFLKRLRKKWGNYSLRYLAAGEYGGKTERPHFHIIIFTNEIIPGWRYIPTEKQWTSTMIENIWKNGYITIGWGESNSIAYTALYTTKKLTKQDHKKILWDDENGIFYERKPEFIVMSRRPALGFNWIKKHKKYFLTKPNEIPKSLITTKIFNEEEIEQIKKAKNEYIKKQFWKENKTPLQKKLENIISEKQEIKKLKKLRNKI